jgi:hypothetical protein
VADDDLVSVEDALRVVRRRGISVEEWSQAIADGAVPSWSHRDDGLRVRLSDARTWLPTTVDPTRLLDLVRERRRLDGQIDMEVQRLSRDGHSWAEIAELLGVTERKARRLYDRSTE